MSLMRTGYGSEWHLRKLLAKDIPTLSSSIIDALQRDNVCGERIEWNRSYLEIGLPEICGLDFLPKQSPVRIEWQQWWPQTGSVHNWDAVGTLFHPNGATEWLLLEAKVNVEELKSNTRAKKHGGLDQIVTRMAETQQACGIRNQNDWTQGHYQYANRLAALLFNKSRNRCSPLFRLFRR